MGLVKYLVLCILSFQISLANATIPVAKDIATQFTQAKKYLLLNLEHPDITPGTVIASPSKVNPNYFYHWVRDGALVMQTVFKLMEREQDPVLKAKYIQLLRDFVFISIKHQQARTQAGLGEVKFHVNGNPFTGPWGRPQNDGPALRATTLIHFAKFLIANGEVEFVKKYLYNTHSYQNVIKNDLEYISHNWTNVDFDLWEEVQGHHFFTLMSQRKALVEGMNFAWNLGDEQAARWYQWQASRINSILETYWSDEKKHIVSNTHNLLRHYGRSGLDVSNILGSIYNNDMDLSYHVLDVRVLSTALKLEEAFTRIYPINAIHKSPGIGRYPEDKYTGTHTDGEGNPWYLATAGLGQLYYNMITELRKKKYVELTPENYNFYHHLFDTEVLPRSTTSITIREGEPLFTDILIALNNRAESFLERVVYHANSQGELAEQFNRYSGYAQGARDLSWSYSSFIEAYMARAQALSDLL